MIIWHPLEGSAWRAKGSVVIGVQMRKMIAARMGRIGCLASLRMMMMIIMMMLMMIALVCRAPPVQNRAQVLAQVLQVTVRARRSAQRIAECFAGVA